MRQNQDGAVILVVEDEPKNMKLIRDLLTFCGYLVLEASDGRQGVDIAVGERPDLILMDIQLPVMDGLEATRFLKADERTREIPIVALTAFAMREDERRIMAAGCQGHISKPIDTRSFLETVKVYLARRRREPVPATRDEKVHRWRILAIDDDSTSLRLYEAMLPEDKYEVLKAGNGRTGLDLASRIHPDVILLDILMPDMDGIEVTKHLKSAPETKIIPVILATSMDDAETKERGFESGAEEFLNKPVNGMELIARVNSMIRLKQYRDQLLIRNESSRNLGISSEGPNGGCAQTRSGPVVLLVEDNPVDAERVRAALAGHSFRLEVVSTGRAALSRLRAGGVDLVLLDLVLPDLDGFEICRRIKSREELANVQIVMVTILDDLESKIKGVELGAEDFLVKPIIGRELVARVKVLLEKKGYLDKLRADYETALDTAKLDWLTGLHNHGYFKQFLDVELKRSARQNYPVGLILADVDNFKNYNDKLGHSAGDAILRELGHVIMSNVREIDLPARYGGEEFAVVLPYADRDVVSGVAVRLHKAIASHNFLYDESRTSNRLTVSMGIAVYPYDAESLGTLVSRADRMLYQAKHNGKNQICVFSSGADVSEAPGEFRPEIALVSGPIRRAG